MKRIVASVGMVALGASGVQAAGDAISSPEPVKPWSVSATLRGFYDDNINSTPTKQEAWGYEVSPSALLKETWEQTSLSLGYTYSFLYYDHTPLNQTKKYDQDHTFNGVFDHRFSERYALNVTDGFVVGQEPDTLRSGVAFNTFQRVSGSNIRNAGAINFDAQLTHLFGLQVGYANSFYDYAATGATQDPVTGNVLPSTAGVLNRIENAVHLDGRWLLERQTTAVLGYQFRDVGYTADEEIAGTFTPVPIAGENVLSDSRNSRMHYGYVGLDHNFRADLMGSVRAGASLSDYYNDPSQSSEVSPYAQISLRYTYAQESYVEGGFTYDRVATDLVGAVTPTSGPISFTTDAQSAVLYATWNHRITPRLFSSVVGQFQNNDYNNGLYNNQTEQFYLLGLNLEYRFTPNFSAHVGYNYDKLVSNITPGDRSFDRNRVYMGIAASY